MDGERLSVARGRLIKAAPYLAPLFGKLRCVPDAKLATCGTDGARFLYNPAWLERAFEVDGGRSVSAALAHSAAHCLLGHLRAKQPEPLACDLAAALLIDGWLPTFCSAHGAGLFLEAKRRLSGVALDRVGDAIARDDFFREHHEALVELLTLDAHSRWTPEPPVKLSSVGVGAEWQALWRRFGSGGRTGFGRTPGVERLSARLGETPRRSYGELLSRYAVFRENPREDPDAFQPGLYAYGLSLYENMPLIEPAEVREERRVEELVIVIDTSGSCVRALTAHFLEEIRAILADEDIFFRSFNLRILQCDARVQREDRITCTRDFERYIDNLEIVGGGGTDFRPAFERIDALITRGAFRALKGALFFSDGRGIFPKALPAYETVFIFYEGHYDAIDVPGWARQLVLPAPMDLGREVT